MSIDHEKLEKLFDKKFMELWKDPKDPEFWVNYCDEHKVLMVHPEWIKETLNEEGLRGRVFIDNPETQYHAVGVNVSPWLLVPRKFAEKCLVLGGLP
jgi:hypothetical protein